MHRLMHLKKYRFVISIKKQINYRLTHHIQIVFFILSDIFNFVSSKTLSLKTLSFYSGIPLVVTLVPIGTNGKIFKNFFFQKN